MLLLLQIRVQGLGPRGGPDDRTNSLFVNLNFGAKSKYLIRNFWDPLRVQTSQPLFAAAAASKNVEKLEAINSLF